MKINRIHARKGSILIEALLSVVILSVSLTAIIYALTSSFRTRLVSDQYLLAVNNLDNKMTALTANSFLNDNKPFTGFYDLPDEYKLTEEKLVFDEAVTKNLDQYHYRFSWKSDKKERAVDIDTLLLNEKQ